MSQATVRQRNEIPVQYTWNAESVFASPQAWEEAAIKIQESLTRLGSYQNRLAGGPTILVETFALLDDLYRQTGKIFVYASIAAAVDTADQAAARMRGRAYGIFGQLMAAGSFIDPELLVIGQETLEKWMKEEPRLAIFAHYISDLFRKQQHVRSTEVEELLGMLSTPFNGVSTTATMLTDADFRFQPAHTTTGAELPVTQGNLDEILAGPDREARRTAWESYMDTYLANQNTLASNLATSIQQNVFMMRARRHNSTLKASLFENNIPVEVFHNLIDTFKRNLPTWHRYWAVRRKALGVDMLQPYDVWAPLTTHNPTISFDQAVDLICAGLKPMGEEYTKTVRQGCLAERWVDVYPNQGKSSAQFSSGFPGTYPFIVINYDDTIFSLSTLAHELGHSMHSYLTWQNQPIIYSQYSLFAAEVASNFHQAMVRAYLLETNADPQFQIKVIEEAMSNFHRYFFI
ncbi:MAG: oligoendopeptidase F family protein, partial [Anaerolineaceae bacterium]|nr:oligoendopeptidase F family protein [Anaerolineaceae bacterium]